MALARSLQRVAQRLSGTQLRGFSALPATVEADEMQRNPAAVLHGVNDLRFEEHPMPASVAAGSVRVQIRALGICGSDVHFLQHGRIGKFVLNAPMVIGHEAAAEVVEVGPGVQDLKEGDRVALEPQLPCWGNKYSRQGRYNLDPGVKFFATPPVHGCLRRFVDHPADACFKMPDSLSYEDGAMVEPLSNAVHAVRRAGVGPGKRVAVLGAGPVGLMVLAACHAFGASNTAIADISPNNLPVAEQLGARHILDLSADKSPAAAVGALRRVYGDGPDIVIDCAGFESTITTALESIAPGGTIGVIGLGQERCCVPIMEAVVKEANLLGMFRYTNTYPSCLELLEEGKIPTGPLITHRYGFSADEVAKGFDAAINARKTGSIKVMFHL